jgi:lipopolysaccharide/colanic/teichoic acid biosynthesis glycosyltransferase
MTIGKRAFDLVASLTGLLLLAPLMFVIAALIRMADGGPALFRQVRVGRDGVPFEMMKFRTMIVRREQGGPQLTVGADPRITRVGRLLRRTKLDELPQLINVLRGEMSMVGPRPEVPRYVALYTPDQRRVLSLVPGITDPASAAYVDEAGLLALADDPERLYVQEIMPAKLRLNLAYAERATLRQDIAMIIGTFAAIARRENRPA